MTNRRYYTISVSHWQQLWIRSLWKWVGIFKGSEKNRTKGRSVRPNLKPHGPRWPAQCRPRPGTPRTSERVYTQRVCYNHLLQEKQALSFEPAAKKKPLLPPSRSERHIQTVSLPQPQNPTTGWLRKKLRGRWQETNCRAEKKKRFILSPNQMKGLRRWISQLAFSNKDQVSDMQSPFYADSQVYWVLDEIRKTACVANLRSDSPATVFISHTISGYELSRLRRWSLHLQMDLLRFEGFRTRERRREGKRATKTDTKESARQTQTVRNKKKEVLQSLVYIPQPWCLKYPQILNLYNHPLSKSPQTIRSAQESGGDI